MSQTASAPPWAILSRQTLIRSLIAAAAIFAGVAALKGLQLAMSATFDKPPAPLRHPLDEISRFLGSPIRYEAAGPDESLDPDTLEALGTNMYLLRRYRDKKVEPDAYGSFMRLNLNYYPSGDSTPHVPENCWAGNGRDEVAALRETFEIKGVKGFNGQPVDLQARMITFQPIPADAIPVSGVDNKEPVYVHVAYVFNVNGNYVSNAKEVMSQFWKAQYHYAYHAKIEMTPVDSRGYPMVGTQAQAKAAITDFIREALPEVESCLPDPAILTESNPPAAAPGK